MTAVLVIAGSDSSGGAGLVRDVRTLTQFRVRALCAVTVVTAQTDAGMSAVCPVPADVVRAQIAAAFATRTVGAVKIGMLGTAATVFAVAAGLAADPGPPVVLDPVLESSSGACLLDAQGRAALRERLLPRVALLTPNIPEAAALLNTAAAAGEEEALAQARQLLTLGPRAVLLKGGHGRTGAAVDFLVTQGQVTQRFAASWIDARQRGTGCALASAIAAGLACGLDLAGACARAREHVRQLLRDGD